MSLSSYVLGVAARSFIIVLGCGLFFARDTLTKKKKVSKNLRRLEQYKEISEDEILTRLRNSNVYSEQFKKGGLKYLNSNTRLFANMISSLKIDLKQLDAIITRADAKDEVSAEELAVNKVIGFFMGFSFLLLGALVNYIFVIIALISYLYFAVNPVNKLDAKWKEKSQKFKKDFPSYIRLVSNATAVGNSIEEALRKVGLQYPSVITDEIRKAELKTVISIDWLQALMETSYDADITEFEQLVSEVRIAKEKGASVTEVLLKLADKVEKENAYDAEEVARKKSSTIIIPVFIFLFVPMLLGILLPVGTSVINMM